MERSSRRAGIWTPQPCGRSCYGHRARRADEIDGDYGPDSHFTMHDVISGRRYEWSSRNDVRLDPIGGEPAHILRVESD